ncbi:hypothetical protein FA95DRAFT_1679983 [Auriscalpium vulgare]|uniref:Uncharacterized protein n=1 Tax=Auriscalpium vulgare TaxID=40419 RepID=A0ACB8RQT0_9AGAM|nr:hypothetical protein FA95DRAFT_1679983 [Auriscalpium vulgare]
MNFLRNLLSASAAPLPAETVFPEENLLLNVPQGDGYFLTRPGALLKAGRYKVIRKLGRGSSSSTFLVEDLSPKHGLEYFAVKVLSVSSTIALREGIIQELDVLQVVKDGPWGPGHINPALPILLDHFALQGPHGVHYCFVTWTSCSDVGAFRATAPTGSLSVYIVKPIICATVDAVRFLHTRDIIHAGMWLLSVLTPTSSWLTAV